MLIGKVISNVISSRKYEGLQGYKLLVIELKHTKEPKYVVAADNIGAGRGEHVLLTSGQSVQYGLQREAPIDMLVIGILDKEPVFENE
ncbi:EutN/CcmL family microcompartment protein [Salipaludibacillus daqingensis]|uniref:EutN/CcmL family microcompartment protein n=1 Tax=Salipaludibacillus daqingensis TaxID=3041001 RepID=UPI00247647AE|nr:EutN/CcmL family microcompartment protein [Salipaludibacillus daqingensis]